MLNSGGISTLSVTWCITELLFSLCDKQCTSIQIPNIFQINAINSAECMGMQGEQLAIIYTVANTNNWKCIFGWTNAVNGKTRCNQEDR